MCAIILTFVLIAEVSGEGDVISINKINRMCQVLVHNVLTLNVLY